MRLLTSSYTAGAGNKHKLIAAPFAGAGVAITAIAESSIRAVQRMVDQFVQMEQVQDCIRCTVMAQSFSYGRVTRGHVSLGEAMCATSPLGPGDVGCGGLPT